MSTIEQSAKGKKDGDIRYLTPLNIETNKTKKYCRFKKSGSFTKRLASSCGVISRFIEEAYALNSFGVPPRSSTTGLPRAFPCKSHNAVSNQALARQR